MLRQAILVLVLAALSSAVQVPADWAERVSSHDAFFAENDDGQLDSTGYPTGLYLVSRRVLSAFHSCLYSSVHYFRAIDERGKH